MFRKPTWRIWLVLFLFAFASLFLAGTPVAQAESEYDDDMEDVIEDFLEENAADKPYDKRWDKSDAELGGGHGGAGATQVPIVDEDFDFMVTWTEDQLEAPRAHGLETGDGVTVAVLDGGFDLDHPWIRRRVSPWGFDAIEIDDNPEDFGNGIDDDGDGFVDNGLGHGTFVAGMVLLAAPDATILPIRVRDDEGWGFNFELELGLEYAWAAGADVVNISGDAAIHDFKHIREMIERMRADGVVVIVSAGNDGWSTLPELAMLPGTIAVASSDKDDRLTDWSNFGEAPMGVLVAPGLGLYGPLWGTDSGYWSGTSFSAGLVSGAAALLLDDRRWLDPHEVHMRLMGGADVAFDGDGNPLPGAGRLNLYGALRQ